MKYAEIGPAGTRIRWVELPGAEPARVYVHGLGAASGACYPPVVAHPALAGRRSLLVDLLGFGLSDRPAEFGYTLEEHADTLAAALDAAGVRQAEVVAHSMGGAVAIVLAARRPDLVAKLVLAEANLDPNPEYTAGSSRIASYSEAEFLAGGLQEVLGRIDPEWRATMRLADPVALHRTAVGLVRGSTPTMRELLLQLPIPRTYLLGALSGPLDGQAELVNSGVVVEIIPGAGHVMMLDNPVGFALATAAALDTRP